MAIKSTDRIKIQQYGEDLSGCFNDIARSLEDLVSGIATANYEGPNAARFKGTCVDDAIRFSESCQSSMQVISGNVEEQTSYIAQNLGGMAIAVAAPSGEVARPTISTDETVELADGDALRAMSSLVDTRMGEIERAFDMNLEQFVTLGRSDGWIGEEYDSLLSQLQIATDDVKGEITTATADINGAIQRQLDALGL